MTVHFPVGYGTQTMPLATIHEHYFVRHGADPEFARRLTAWLASTNGKIGVGSAWRSNPNNVSKASRTGHSFHQTQRFSNGSHRFMAVDLVVVHPGHVHRAPYAHEVPVQGSHEAAHWGVHVNVGTPGSRGFESWHIQCTEVDGYGHWVSNGRHAPPTKFLPHSAARSPTVAMRDHPSVATGHHIPQASMKQGSVGNEVKFLQLELRTWHHNDHRITDPGTPDGNYGPLTAWSLALWQREIGGIHSDGEYGPQTQAKYQQVSDYLSAMNPETG